MQLPAAKYLPYSMFCRGRYSNITNYARNYVKPSITATHIKLVIHFRHPPNIFTPKKRITLFGNGPFRGNAPLGAISRIFKMAFIGYFR